MDNLVKPLSLPPFYVITGEFFYELCYLVVENYLAHCIWLRIMFLKFWMGSRIRKELIKFHYK
jgi:hypothetical protein